MLFGNLAQALTLIPVTLDDRIVERQRIAADVLALKVGAPHAGARPLDDQGVLSSGNDAEDDDDSPAQRASGIDVLSEADVLDVEPVELVQHIEEMLHRPGDPV